MTHPARRPSSIRTLVLLAALGITTTEPLSAQVIDAPVRYDTDYLSADFHRGGVQRL